MCFLYPPDVFPFRNEGEAQAPEMRPGCAGGIGQELSGQWQLKLQLFWRKVLVCDALSVAVSCSG